MAGMKFKALKLLSIENLIGLTLLLGSLAKMHVYRNQGELSPADLAVPIEWFPLLSALEASLAAWLFSGTLKRWSRLVTLIVLVVFFVASITKGMAGENSCGCFGVAKINPWLMATYNAGAAVLLFASKSPKCGEPVLPT